MISEKEKLAEWLLRVADSVSETKLNNQLTKQQLLTSVRQSYAIISVLIKVANGQGTILGTPPVNCLH